ncbi:MAG: GTP-binding protein [Methanolinea sp.]|nr:GTP-binding protein [Methanolinea sp.]
MPGDSIPGPCPGRFLSPSRPKNQSETVKKANGTYPMMAGGKLKVVVFGAYNAGKSTLIQTLDPSARHVEAHTGEGDTTIALDYGRVVVHALNVYLFGTPGQDRFEFVRQIIARGMDAAILVVDCSVPPDEFTLHLYSAISGQRVPLAVILNKCDLPDACPADLEKIFQNAMVFAVCARDKAAVTAALTRFIESFMKEL